VVLFLAESARSLKTGTLRRRLSSIAVAHEIAGHASPTSDPIVKTTWKGIRRTNGTAERGKPALAVDELRMIVRALPETTAGCRDRCLLLLGFSTAMRRSELVGLDVEDLAFVEQGLVVHLQRSKTDQDGAGRHIGVSRGASPATCAVAACSDWLTTAGLDSGPLFRPVDRHGNIGPHRMSDRSVALVLKRRAPAVGLDPTDLAGHSLRSGFATAAAQAGATELEIMRQTGHRSVDTLRRYVRSATLFDATALDRIDL
jgi:integrase